MFCFECGTSLVPASKFCSSCGAAQNRVEGTELYASETIQGLLDEVWSKYRLDDPWWENQPDASFLNELDSVKGLARLLKDHSWDPQQLFQIVISRVSFNRASQEQWLIYGLAALDTANEDVLVKFWEIFIPDGLDFYMVYWMAYNPSSPATCLASGAEFAMENEDPELLEILVKNPNLEPLLRQKCLEVLAELI